MSDYFKIIPFADLFYRLKRAGYPVPVQTIYEFEKLLIVTDCSEFTAADAIRVLVPMIAKSSLQQEEIKKIITEYFEAVKAEQIVGRRKKWKVKWAKPLAIASVIFYALCFFLINRSYSNREEVRKKITESVNSTYKAYDGGGSITSGGVTGNTMKSTLTPGRLTDKAFLKTSEITQSLYDDSMKALVRGKGQLYRLPYEGPVFLYAISETPLVITYKTWWYFLLFSAGSLLILYFYFRYSGSTALPQLYGELDKQSDGVDYDQPPYEIRFASDGGVIINPNSINLDIAYLVRNSLAADPGSRINVAGTARAAARNGGYVRPLYQHKTFKYNSVFLLENSQPESHISQLYDWLAGRLSSEAEEITKYYFQDSLNTFISPSGARVSLTTASQLITNSYLLLFGDAGTLLDERTGQLKNTALLIKEVAQLMIVITHKPVADWSFAELSLIKRGVVVVPAEIEAIQFLLTGQQNALLPADFTAIIENPYTVAAYDFDNVADIEEYLYNDSLFKWVCALSLYPSLQWPLTLEIGKLLQQNYKDCEGLVTYETLLKISRIKWFSLGYFSDTVRLALMQHLDPDLQLKVRLLIKEKLNDLEGTLAGNSFAVMELARQRNINDFLIHAKYGLSILAKKGLWSRLQHSLRQAYSLLVSPFGERGKVAKSPDILHKEGFDRDVFRLLLVQLRAGENAGFDWVTKAHINRGTNTLLPRSSMASGVNMNMDEYFLTYENRFYKRSISKLKRSFYIRTLCVALIIAFFATPSLSSWLPIMPVRRMSMQIFGTNRDAFNVSLPKSFFGPWRRPILTQESHGIRMSNLTKTYCQVDVTLHDWTYPSTIILSGKENRLCMIGAHALFVADNTTINLAEVYGYPRYEPQTQFAINLYKALLGKSATFISKYAGPSTYVSHNLEKRIVSGDALKQLFIDEMVPGINFSNLILWSQSVGEHKFAAIFKSEDKYFIFFVKDDDGRFGITDIIY